MAAPELSRRIRRAPAAALRPAVARPPDNAQGQAMRRLALFARPPEPGHVKTRLAPALTPGLALELYRAMLADALEQGARVADERSVWWSGAPEPALDAGLRAELETGGWRE